MTLGIFELDTLRDEAGNAVVVTGAQVTVRDAETLALAPIYEDRGGEQGLSNPFTVSGSTIVFYATDEARYRITVEAGSFARTFEDQSVSTRPLPSVVLGPDDLAAAGKLVGEVFALWDHLAGAQIPDNSGNAKYVKLTAGEDGPGGYNDGLLTGESISGSGALLVATAVLSVGPMQGETIYLINSMGAFLRAAASGDYQQDQMQRITGSITGVALRAFSSSSGDGALSLIGETTVGTGTSGAAGGIGLDSATSPGARTGDNTRPKSVGATFYMRIA